MLYPEYRLSIVLVSRAGPLKFGKYALDGAYCDQCVS